MNFRGTYTALATPFLGNGIDTEAFRAHIERQIAAGVEGIVPVGTTGESPTVTHEEHREIIRVAVEAANKRCLVIAGTGSNSTAEAVDLTYEAERCGADAALLVTPYYNKPSQEGLFRHFCAVANSTDMPIILYSIPGRCVIELAVETVARLAAECPNIVAIKEAGGKVERVTAMRAALPPTFDILSGDDALTLPFMREGGVGVISVASNLVPAEVSTMVRLALDNRMDEAQVINDRLDGLFHDLFVEPNPVPLKYAMHLQGWCSADVRLPLCEMSEENCAKLRATLASLELGTRG